MGHVASDALSHDDPPLSHPERQGTLMRPISFIRTAPAVVALAALHALTACNQEPTAAPAGPSAVVSQSNESSVSYGPSVAVGNGSARTYVLFDQKQKGRAIELGVALTADAMDGLPAPMDMPPTSSDGHEHVDSHEYLLALPEHHGTAFKFLELDWNPQGHEVQGIYTVPHFDFHFYTITKGERDLILPSDPTFQQKADNLPPAALVPQFYSTLTPPGVPTPAVPKMGVHWIDVRSPEIQALLGNPDAAKPFTTTFLFGSWDGRFVFAEPMVTRAFIMGRRTAATDAQRDSVMALPAGAKASPGGFMPGAYRVSWNAEANEYRIALTQLTSKN